MTFQIFSNFQKRMFSNWFFFRKRNRRMEDFSLPFSNLNTAECKNIVYVVKKIWRQKITNGGPYISCCSNKKVIKIHAVTWEVTCAWFPFTGKTIAFSFYGDNTWISRVHRNLSFVIFNIIFFLSQALDLQTDCNKTRHIYADSSIRYYF